MYIVRPVQRKDLEQLYALAKLVQAGLTTLPCDKKLLRARIEESCHGFAKNVSRSRGEVYLFVMEDTRTKKLVGTSSIISNVGVKEPFYTYEVKTAHMMSKALKVKKVIRYLKLKIIRNGPTETGTLFLKPSARQPNCGRLLAFSRYLFMAQYRQRFTDKVIAELRGVIDDKGHSPFWNAVGQHFFVVDFKKADLMVMKDKSFIADLIPKHPIYIPILPLSAQAVIGQVHEHTLPALKLLQSEGFEYVPEIDIFEAGPTLVAKTGHIRTVRKSKTAKVRAIVERLEAPTDYLIANVDSYKEFRVTKDKIITNEKGVTLTEQAAQALNLTIGQRVRFVKAKG
jgi:arginine N-succinyltransferase